ncbi:hypothetical protein KAK06_16670 [Ideonella sp. 4Y11]|uniref:DUF4189 domain-containing protein n=1 Tax=Ideonella aquatica TaxID=2824119 RepID=A0A940YI85_9BURK|nr:hypothetical protein [Ideonella aquatica]MBQ0960590.1 hypothetical protein [Ideonella aquatica]
MNRLLTPWLLSLTLALGACQAGTPPATPPAANVPADLPGLGQALDQAIGDAACRADSDCRTVPLGHRACGGPSSYRAYSLLGGQQARILVLAQAQREAMRAQVEQRGLVSDCRALMDPGAQCVAGRCVPRADVAGRAVY